MRRFCCFVIALLLLFNPGGFAQEMRGLWVDAFHNGIKTSSQVTQLVADARAANMNALFVQVRKRGDAYYNSLLEPKATDVSPQSFDPLADLIQKSNSGGPILEVHAWIVSYNIWNNESTLPSQPAHPYLLHPDWLTERNDGVKFDGGNYAFDQAHPEVQRHTFAVCEDILSRYEVDGLHFDYIRYTDSNSSVGNQPWGYHPVAVQRFLTLTGRTGRPFPNDAQWLQFRRDQVSALVRKVYLNAWRIRRGARISAACISYGGPPADNSFAAWTGRDAYGRVLQDWRGWLQEGILDLAVPMIYRDFTIAARKSEWEAWCGWSRDNQFARQTAAGQAPYLNTVGGTINEIKFARNVVGGKSLAGMVGYSYGTWCRRLVSGSTYESNYVPRSEFIDALTDDTVAETYDPGGAPVFTSTVSAPAMPWKSDVTKGHVMGTVSGASGGIFDGATITIAGPVTRTVRTDATGFFGAVDLPAGTYSVTVSASGYPPATQTITVTGALVAEADFTLRTHPLEITSNSWNRSQRRMTLTWNSVGGNTYRVELSSNLATWTPLAAGITATGALATWTSNSLPVADRYFFRVVEE